MFSLDLIFLQFLLVPELLNRLNNLQRLQLLKHPSCLLAPVELGRLAVVKRSPSSHWVFGAVFLVMFVDLLVIIGDLLVSFWRLVK